MYSSVRAENRISRPIEVQREDCGMENITSQVHLASSGGVPYGFIDNFYIFIS